MGSGFVPGVSIHLRSLNFTVELEAQEKDFFNARTRAAIVKGCPAGDKGLQFSLGDPNWLDRLQVVRPLKSTWQDRMGTPQQCIRGLPRSDAVWKRPASLQPYSATTLLNLLVQNGYKRLLFLGDSWISHLVPAVVDRLAADGLEVVGAARSVLNGKLAKRGGCAYSRRWRWTLRSRDKKTIEVEQLGLHCPIKKPLSANVYHFLRDSVCGSGDDGRADQPDAPCTACRAYNEANHSVAHHHVWEGRMVSDADESPAPAPSASTIVVSSFGLHYNAFAEKGMSELRHDLHNVWATVRSVKRTCAPARKLLHLAVDIPPQHWPTKDGSYTLLQTRNFKDKQKEAGAFYCCPLAPGSRSAREKVFDEVLNNSIVHVTPLLVAQYYRSRFDAHFWNPKGDTSDCTHLCAARNFELPFLDALTTTLERVVRL